MHRASTFLLASAIAALTLITPGGLLATHGPAVTPLNDLGSGTYLGFQGGLYDDGSNTVPADHAAAGSIHAAAVEPLDTSGAPNVAGKIVLLSVGMSNTTQEFCSASSALPCDPWTFMGLAAADQTANHTSLVIVNGAAGGQTAATWDSPLDANFDRVRDTRLTPAGVTEAQVQAAWVKVANAGPTSSLPAANADAYALETLTGSVMRAMKARYPNLQMVFLSSRIYAGYATTALNPEPYAYESGLAMKWLVQAQVDQVRNGGVIVDPRGGNLDYTSGVAPWLGWGAYLWADGLIPRSDGLTWAAADFAADGTHPSTSGRGKVGDMLFDFFSASDYTRCWFLADVDGDGLSDICDLGDFDGDSLSDRTEYYCGSPPDDLNRRPERVDSTFETIDDDGDTLIDEALPTGAGVVDCDGDGYKGSAEDHVFSYLPQINGDQKTCQEYDTAFPNVTHKPSKRWSADLNGSAFSLNKVNVQDLAAFTAPIKYLNKNVGTNPNDARFDLVPGSTIGFHINVSDMAALSSGASGFPPMLGAKAFGGPVCPYAP